jgi:hypothetical protein
MYSFYFFNFGLGITFYYHFQPSFSLYNGIIFVTVPRFYVSLYMSS